MAKRGFGRSVLGAALALIGLPVAMDAAATENGRNPFPLGLNGTQVGNLPPPGVYLVNEIPLHPPGPLQRFERQQAVPGLQARRGRLCAAPAVEHRAQARWRGRRDPGDPAIRARARGQRPAGSLHPAEPAIRQRNGERARRPHRHAAFCLAPGRMELDRRRRHQLSDRTFRREQPQQSRPRLLGDKPRRGGDVSEQGRA